MQDIFYLFYYIIRNIVFSTLFWNSAILRILNSLIKIKHEELNSKILKQTGLFLKDLDKDQIDKVIHYGSGFVSYRVYFQDKLYFDYDKYIYSISNKNWLSQTTDKLRTLLISISVFQHIKNFESTMDEVLSENITEIRTVIDCSLQYFPKVRNRLLVDKLKGAFFFDFITRHIHISERSITDYLFYFESNGFEVVTLNYVNKAYKIFDDDEFKIYYIVLRKISK